MSLIPLFFQSVSLNLLLFTFQLSSAASLNLERSQNGVLGNRLFTVEYAQNCITYMTDYLKQNSTHTYGTHFLSSDIYLLFKCTFTNGRNIKHTRIADSWSNPKIPDALDDIVCKTTTFNYANIHSISPMI